VDGGAAQNDWLMEFQAGILGVPVRRPALVETTARGAAGLAGLATGVWDDAREFLESGEEARVFSPALDTGERETLLRGWRRAVRTARSWARDDRG